MNKTIQNIDFNTNEIVIIGSSGHAVSVANVALSKGYKIKFFLSKNPHEKELLGYRVIEEVDNYDSIEGFNIAVGIGNNSIREYVVNEINRKCSNIYFPTLIHETAVISYYTKIGEGAIIMPLSVVGPNSTVGKFCLINTRASIDHDCIMNDFSSLAPAATTGGKVRIGYRSAISIGAVIKDNLSVGNDSILGSNSYLHHDLGSDEVAVGSPAVVIKKR